MFILHLLGIAIGIFFIYMTFAMAGAFIKAVWLSLMRWMGDEELLAKEEKSKEKKYSCFSPEDYL